MIPNIGRDFRQSQQFGKSLAEQQREFDEAKEQRDQQFYTNMFVSPLMQMGTGSLGKFIGEQMPLEQERLKGMGLINESQDLDNYDKGNTLFEKWGGRKPVPGSPDAGKPTPVGPPKPIPQRIQSLGQQSTFTPSGIEPTPSPNTNLFAGLPSLSDMVGSGGSHAGVPFSAGSDSGLDLGALEAALSKVPGATQAPRQISSRVDVSGPPADLEPVVPAAMPKGGIGMPAVPSGAPGFRSLDDRAAPPMAKYAPQVVPPTTDSATPPPQGLKIDPTAIAAAIENIKAKRREAADGAGRGPAMPEGVNQSRMPAQMSMRPATPPPPAGPPSAPRLPLGRGVEDAGLATGMIEQGAKDLAGDGTVTRPTDFDPAKARAMMPQEEADALLKRFGKYGVTMNDIARLSKQADAQQDLALGQQNAAVRERGETTLQRATDSIKDLGTQEIHVGKMSFKVPKYELNPVAKAMVDRGMDVPMSMLITPLDGKAVGVEMMKLMPRGGGGAKGGFIGGDGQIYTGPVVDSTYEGLKLGGHFKRLGIDLPKNPTQAQKGAIITSIRFHPGGKEALDGILGVKVGTSANIASSLASLFTSTASKEKIAGDKNATAEKIAGDKNATTIQVTGMKLSGEERKAKIAQKTAILKMISPSAADKTKSAFLIRTNATANGMTPAQYRASLQKTLGEIENDLKQSAE